jgi:hypothetical protein
MLLLAGCGGGGSGSGITPEVSLSYPSTALVFTVGTAIAPVKPPGAPQYSGGPPFPGAVAGHRVVFVSGAKVLAQGY